MKKSKQDLSCKGISSFCCQRERFTIRGFEYRGKENNRIPVIISHGFLSNQKRMKEYAKRFAMEGYVVFTYDFCGGALGGKSSGKFYDMSIDSEKDDLKAVIQYVEALSYIDKEKLVLFGESQGGFVSCLVASEQKEAVDTLMLLYPALCIPDDARKGKMLMMEFNPEDIEGTMKSKPFRFSPQYPLSAINIKIFEKIEHIEQPIFIVHGSADNIVDITYAQNAIASSKNKDSKLVILEGAGHGFNKKQAKEALAHMVAYLNKRNGT